MVDRLLTLEGELLTLGGVSMSWFDRSKMESEFEVSKNGSASSRHFLQHQGPSEGCRLAYSSGVMPMHLE